jgi:hypothetical protein
MPACQTNSPIGGSDDVHLLANTNIGAVQSHMPRLKHHGVSAESVRLWDQVMLQVVPLDECK